jgi:hypothetical protein
MRQLKATALDTARLDLISFVALGASGPVRIVSAATGVPRASMKFKNIVSECAAVDLLVTLPATSTWVDEGENDENDTATGNAAFRLSYLVAESALHLRESLMLTPVCLRAPSPRLSER